MSQPRIAEIECGDANPRLDTIAKLAHALGVTIGTLLAEVDGGGVPAAVQTDAAEYPPHRPQVRRVAERPRD